MNNKFSSSSSSATVTPHPARSTSTSSNTHSTPTPTPTTPAVIPLDYNYQTMSPSSLSQLRSHTNNSSHTFRTRQQTQASPEFDLELSNQYSSLFGDPVPPPPPPDFLTTQFEAAHLYRPASLELSSGDDEGFGRTVTLNVDRTAQARLFSHVPFGATFTTRRLSDATTSRNFEVLPAAVPRLQPPDIQILPNSSGGSSSEPQDSPNYALLTPDDILRRPALYDVSDEPADVTETLETMTISDATGRREYSEATRRVSHFSEDFRPHLDALSNTPIEDTPTPQPTGSFSRQFSNESYSSNEWFRPATHDYPEFSKIPRLRPSSKNIMSIKRAEMPMQHSPVAAMINDSNGSSSGEERLLNTTQVLEHPTVSLDVLTPPARPPDPSPTRLREMESELLLSPPTQYTLQRRKSSLDSLGSNFLTPPNAPAPALSTSIQEETEASEESKSIKREMSPVIMRDSITTGGDYRVDQPRLHKKSSFTIISEKSPQSSRAQSPSTHSTQQRSPSKASMLSGSSAKPIAKPRYRLQHKSLSSTQLRLPQLPQAHQTPSDDSPRPSVQFNMTGRYSPIKMPQRGILHQRESLTSSQDTPLPSTTPTPTPTSMRRHSILPSTADLRDGHKMKSCEMLPLITDPYRTAIPRLNRSTLDLRRESAIIPPGELPRPLKPNPNPTRKQKGLLRVINGADKSHIPLRSNWASMDDLTLENRHRPFTTSMFSGLEKRRRSSSTSPERRSSTQTASDRRSSNLSTITTSDFSYRRPSITPQPQRRKSIMPTPSPTTKRRQSLSANNLPLVSGRTSRTKIAKPSTLSPIIGTPNKDSSAPQSPTREMPTSLAASETPSDINARRDSLSKIPVLNSNSRSNSRMNSRSGSRSSSPIKDFTAQLPLSGLTSRATSSRTPSRMESQTNSRAPSRSVSRASTRPISRAASRNSSRPNSRMEQAKELANSRSNSRMSMHSVATPRAGSVSPSAAHRSGATSPAGVRRRKSISQSPQPNRRSLTRRQSPSPPSKSRVGSRGRGKTQREQTETRRDSRSRIPLRSSSSTRAVRSPTRRKTTAVARSRSKSRSPNTSKITANTRGSIRKQSPLTKSANQRKQSASAKKAPTSVQKRESSVKRTPSSVGKQTTAAKKQPSNLQKTGGSNLKREASNLQKKRSGTGVTAVKMVKREASTTSMKKPGTSGSTATDSKRQTSSTGAAGKTADTKESGSAIQNSIDDLVGTATVSEATKITAATAAAATAAVATAVATSSGTGTGTASSGSGSSASGKRRPPSNVTLVRMASRMSLLSLKRTDSNLSKKIPAVAEETLPLVETNGHTPLRKVNSRGQLMTPEEVATLPAAILEKSQKTLENIQKTVTEATDEIHKTIHENLTDLKSLETDMGRMSDSAGSPTPSVATVVENKGGKNATESTSRIGTADGAATKTKKPASAATQKSPLPPTQPIEANVAVVNAEHVAAATAAAVGGGSNGVTLSGDAADATAERNYEYVLADKAADGALSAAVRSETPLDARTAMAGDANDGDAEIKRRSPDGQGGSTAGSGNGSREFLKEQDDESPPTSSGCCRCCSKFCMPCRRSRCLRCCRRKKAKPSDESEQPVLSATSSATTTNLEVIDETAKRVEKPQKTSCWQRLNCCKHCRKKPKVAQEETMTAAQQTKVAGSAVAPASSTTTTTAATTAMTPSKQGKCGLCLSKIFCCRAVNKVDPTTGDETQLKKCCFCIPCRRKRDVHASSRVGSMTGSTAWQDPERGITATDASVLEGAADVLPKQSCCKRFWSKLLCCRKKQLPSVSDSRRASIKAPPPPAEDTRRKLHVDLVEYNSKMKGAIPVLPLYLAWFCAICNIVLPGLGTLLSGFFCICVGIPRFSQYDSAKARLGSFIINIIVAVAQLFCVLFCFVGWGWSIWWGTIMLKCARKLSKIKKVERLEMEEEKRQAEAAAAAAAAARAAAAAAAAAATTTTTTTVTETEPAKN